MVFGGVEKNTFRRPSAPPDSHICYADTIRRPASLPDVCESPYPLAVTTTAEAASDSSAIIASGEVRPEYGLRWCCSAPSEIIDYRLINRYMVVSGCVGCLHDTKPHSYILKDMLSLSIIPPMVGTGGYEWKVHYPAG